DALGRSRSLWQQAEEDEGPAEAFGFGDVAGRCDETGEPVVGDGVGIDGEGADPNLTQRPLAVEGKQGRACPDEGPSARYAYEAFWPRSRASSCADLRRRFRAVPGRPRVRLWPAAATGDPRRKRGRRWRRGDTM